MTMMPPSRFTGNWARTITLHGALPRPAGGNAGSWWRRLGSHSRGVSLHHGVDCDADVPDLVIYFKGTSGEEGGDGNELDGSHARQR
jgi:hypothetical protein